MARDSQLLRLNITDLKPDSPPKLSAKDSRGQPVTFDQRPPERLPSWVEQLVDANNRLVEAVQVLENAPKNEYRVIEFRTNDEGANGEGVETNFPMFVSLATRPRGVHFIRPVNVDSPTTLFYEQPGVDFAFADGGILIRYISGLNVSTRYSLTMELVYA